MRNACRVAGFLRPCAHIEGLPKVTSSAGVDRCSAARALHFQASHFSHIGQTGCIYHEGSISGHVLASQRFRAHTYPPIGMSYFSVCFHHMQIERKRLPLCRVSKR